MNSQAVLGHDFTQIIGTELFAVMLIGFVEI
jgi:hypothetical protein